MPYNLARWCKIPKEITIMNLWRLLPARNLEISGFLVNTFKRNLNIY